MAAGKPFKGVDTIDVATQIVAAIAALGTFTALDAGEFAGAEIMTLKTGIKTHVLTFTVIDGVSTTKDVVDIGGGPTTDDIAARVEVAVDLAQAAGDIDMTADAVLSVCTFTNDTAGPDNQTITTTLTGAAATVVGMAGGAAAVPAFFTSFDVRVASRADHGDAVYRTIRLKAPAAKALKYSFAGTGVDPDTSPGPFATIAAGASVNLTFTEEEEVNVIFVSGDAATGAEFEYTYSIKDPG